jgi:hypothetical protein
LPSHELADLIGESARHDHLERPGQDEWGPRPFAGWSLRESISRSGFPLSAGISLFHALRSFRGRIRLLMHRGGMPGPTRSGLGSAIGFVRASSDIPTPFFRALRDVCGGFFPSSGRLHLQEQLERLPQSL